MDFTEKGVVTFTIPAFVDEIVRNAEVATIADTPAGNDLFYIEEKSGLIYIYLYYKCDYVSMRSLN